MLITSKTVAYAPNPPISLADFLRQKASLTTRVLLLGNDIRPQAGLALSLIDADYVVIRAETVEMAIALAMTGDFDIAIVDFRPDFLGYEAVCRLRMAQVDLPILFVSACATADAFVRAYAVGADDVVVLPLELDGLKARIASLVRNPALSLRSSLVRVGALEIDLVERCARVDGMLLDLASDEYAALELLVSRNGALVAHVMIAASPAESAALMARLRRKLAKAGAGDLIRTVRGLGFALGEVGAVRGGYSMSVARAA